jgi:hypothetical protein
VAAADVRSGLPARSSDALRNGWLLGTIGLTLASIIAAIGLAPPVDATPSTALVWLLFIGSSVHVGATAWFYTVREVRAHMRAHRARYVWAPLALVIGSAATAALIGLEVRVWWLLAFFAWQFFHFQKQNLGMAALAARASRVAGLSRVERSALVGAGVGGIAALLGHPELLQLGRPAAAGSGVYDLIFGAGASVFLTSAGVGALATIRRPVSERPTSFLVVYGISLAFFAPVFCFDSPYAAVAGLTIAHGLQYLLLMSLIAGTPSDVAPARVGVLLLMNLAVILGLVLNQAAHMDRNESLVGRVIFGVFLGLSMAHFVIDAGLWRLRDEFPRSFLGQRLPYLIAR